MELMDKYIVHKKKALDRRTCEHVINIFEKSSPHRNERDYWGIYPSLAELPFSFLKPILRKYICEYLKKHILQDKYRYDHHWEDGDVVISEQWLAIHRRNYFENMKERLLHRIAIF